MMVLAQEGRKWLFFQKSGLTDALAAQVALILNNSSGPDELV